MQQKKIVIFIISLFILSSAWLFSASKKAVDPDFGKNFWTLYFFDPKSDDLDFVIENHSDQVDFHYEILKDKQRLEEKDLKIEKGRSEKIDILDVSQKGKITIRVTAGDEKKEVYKNL